MVYGLYSIYDKLVGYQSPTALPNDNFAFRSFSEGFSDIKNPQDYILYKLGEFNLKTGELITHAPVQIACALDFLKGEDSNA